MPVRVRVSPFFLLARLTSVSFTYLVGILWLTLPFRLPVQEILAGSLSVMEYLVLETPAQHLTGVHRHRGRASIRVAQENMAAVLPTYQKP
jgi:hypothetical protein